jgi:hypothetical protein
LRAIPSFCVIKQY